MKTKYDAYNSWVSFFIVTCETLITGRLFYRKHSINSPFHSKNVILLL